MAEDKKPGFNVKYLLGISLVSALMFLVSALGSGYAPTFTQFVLYRLLGGIGIGIAATLSPIYIAEVSPAKLRGRFVSLNQMTIVIGILLAQLVNYLILQSHPVPEGVSGSALLETWNGTPGWRLMFAAEALPALLFFLFMFVIPNSPRWLCRVGKTEKARIVMEKIGGPQYAADSLVSITETFDESSKKHELAELIKPKMRRILIIGFTNFIFTILAMTTVDKLGRKILILWGCVGLAISYTLIGICFHQHIEGVMVLLAVLAAIACFSATLGPVMLVLISEIFPNRVRGLAASMAVLALWTANFILQYTFPIIKNAYSIAATFWVYAAVCVLGVIFIKMYIPETKGKTLEEIEASLLKS